VIVEARLLRGLTSQQLLRWVATALAATGIGCDPPAAKRRSLPVVQPNVVVDSPPAPAPGEGSRVALISGFPASFGEEQACSWLSDHGAHDDWKSELRDVPEEQYLREQKVRSLFGDDLVPLLAPATAPDGPAIAAALEVAEARGLYAAIIAARTFQLTEPLAGRDLIDLLARVEHHARMAIALRRAQSLTAPVVQRPWISKAGPPRCGVGETVPADFIPQAKKAYEEGDAGTWDKDARLALVVVQAGTLTLWRRGAAEPLAAGASVDLRRLDVLSAGADEAILEHQRLERIVIPAGEALGPWNTASFLSAAAKRKLEETVRAAADGDRGALDRLDAVLPAARTFILEELRARPDAPGAPGLRLQLALMIE
jgi:hypothetical protein